MVWVMGQAQTLCSVHLTLVGNCATRKWGGRVSPSPRPLPRADRDAPLGYLQSAGAQPPAPYLTLVTLTPWEFPECLFL